MVIIGEQRSFFSHEPDQVDQELIKIFLSLFYFANLNLDYQTLSVLVKHFKEDLRYIYSKSEDELKTVFAQYYCIKGYVNTSYFQDEYHVSRALKYADNQLKLLGSNTRGRVVLRTEETFPKQLLVSDFDINWLFVHPSKLPSLAKPIVAIVGSRHSSQQQLDAARNAAKLVALKGGTVITGLATGADTAAYEGAMEHNGQVIGVLGTGIRKMYPKENAIAVQNIISSDGYIISELPPDFPGNRSSFILRNRIIAALSDVIIGVSGKYYSGTGHTIRFGHQMKKKLISLDPDNRSGISELIEERGGKALTPNQIELQLERS